MPFPASPKVTFDRNQLVQVICQLRFPPILRIDTEIPSHFQDGIREQFPIYKEKIESQVVNVEGMKLPEEILRQIPVGSRAINHEFSTENLDYKVNLARNFVALTASKYTRWSEFKELLQMVIGHFVKIYKPKQYDRIGLRYINLIDRSALELQSDVPWSALIQRHMLGILGDENVIDDVQEFEYKTRLALEGGKGYVRILSQFATGRDDSEKSYLIDSDFYSTERVEIGSAEATLDFLNNQAARLIQWAITTELYELWRPKEG